MAMEYEAFISYARGVATPIAQALREGISKYNKKWNQAVSTRIYLDEKSLGVAPSLTDELKAALGRSGWLVLLLTRRAAEETSWVGKEVECWLESKSADRILLVACEGKIAWEKAKQDFSDDSDCVPKSLRGVFKDEPCWMDLSWFDADSDLRSPRFQDAIIALYSRVHKISPDEARMANDSNLRRNRRLAKGAIIVLSALLVVSIIASIAALWQTQRAQERERAALALAMSAKAKTMVNENARIASLLAVQAYRMAPSRETREALHEVAAGPQRLVRIDRLPAVSTALTVPPDGNPLVGTKDGKVYRWIVEEGRFEHVLSVDGPSPDTSIRRIGSDHAGERLLLQYGGEGSDQSMRCLLWAATGEEDLGECRVAAISPDGKTYIVDRMLYGEKVPNGRHDLKMTADAVSVEFHWYRDTFTMMRSDGSLEFRKIADPGRVTGLDERWPEGSSYTESTLSPGGYYRIAHAGADDTVQVRDIYALGEVHHFSTKMVNPRVSGTDPSGSVVFSAGEEGVYWVFIERVPFSYEKWVTPPEHLAGLSKIRFATMVNDSTLVGASETHIAMWVRGRVSRIARASELPVTTGHLLGIRPSFSPDSEYASFCYVRREDAEMFVIRLSDVRITRVSAEGCIQPRWSTNSEYVASAGVNGEPELWLHVQSESVVQMEREPELVPVGSSKGGNSYDDSISAYLARNGSEVRIVGKADQAVLLRFREPHGRSTQGEPLSGSGLSPDGRYFFSASFPWERRVNAGEEIQVWMLDTEEIVRTVCLSAIVPLSPEEWIVGLPGFPVPERLSCS